MKGSCEILGYYYLWERAASQTTLAMAGAMYSCVEEGPKAPDWVDLFVKAFMRSAPKKTGNIMIGGMITLDL